MCQCLPRFLGEFYSKNGYYYNSKEVDAFVLYEVDSETSSYHVVLSVNRKSKKIRSFDASGFY